MPSFFTILSRSVFHFGLIYLPAVPYQRQKLIGMRKRIFSQMKLPQWAMIFSLPVPENSEVHNFSPVPLSGTSV